jgi:hypothetical protein
MTPPSLLPLRFVLGTLLVGTVVTQAALPGLAAEVGGGYAETAHLVTPYAVTGIAAVAGGQVTLVALWRLLTAAEAGRLATPSAARTLVVAGSASAAAMSLAAAVLAHLLGVVGVGGPGAVLLLGACLAAVAAAALLVVRAPDLLAWAAGTTGPRPPAPLPA